jgi:hypothetical protein
VGQVGVKWIEEKSGLGVLGCVIAIVQSDGAGNPDFRVPKIDQKRKRLLEQRAAIR